MNKTITQRLGIIFLALAGFIPAVKAQPYWAYWFAEAFGYGVHGGTRTIDFIVFFALFTSLIYLTAKNLFGEKGAEKTSKAVIVLSVSLGLALTMALLASTKFSLSLLYPFAKNLLFFLFVFLLYMFLFKYGGMEKHKVWAFIAALVISFLIFNVANCFISESGQGSSCNTDKLLGGMGKPFKSVGDWFSEKFNDGKSLFGKGKKATEDRLSDLKKQVLPKEDEANINKAFSCKELIKQAKSPSLLCKIKDTATDTYNFCTGDETNPYNERTRWRLAMNKCQQEMSSAADKAEAKVLYDQARIELAMLDAEKLMLEKKYAGAASAYQKISEDAGATSAQQAKAKTEFGKAAKLRDKKVRDEKLKGARENLRVGAAKTKEADTASGERKAGLYDEAIKAYSSALKDALALKGEVAKK